MPFCPPRLDLDLDLEASIRRLPPGAAVKGIFFNDVFKRADPAITSEELFARAAVARCRYMPFFDYPYADWMRIAVVAACALHPGGTSASGMRELGRHAYDAFLGSHIGRVLFGVLGGDARAVLRTGPRAYRAVLNFGEITASPIDDHTIRYRFRNFPCFIETYQVGVFEGVLRHCKAEGVVLVDLLDETGADVDITLTEAARR